MKTNIFYQKNNNEDGAQRMTSLEIAELTGKQHFHVMEAIRKMELAWEKVSESKFRLVEYRDRKGELRPCYSLTKTECLYIATKFNDEARARLVLRWEELEREGRPTPNPSRNGGEWLRIVADYCKMGTQVIVIAVNAPAFPAFTGGVRGGSLPEYRPYHGPVRKLIARTAHGIVREGVDDYTLYIRIPSKAYLEALDVSMEEFFEAEFEKLMVQCSLTPAPSPIGEGSDYQ